MEEMDIWNKGEESATCHVIMEKMKGGCEKTLRNDDKGVTKFQIMMT